METGEEGQENVAFVQIDELPEYTMCLLKKGIVTNDEEIYETVKDTGVTYYRYYAIAEDEKEKLYLASFDDAEEVIDQLKDKESTNASDLTIVEKYETELPDLTTTSKAVSSLYKKKVVVSTNVSTSRVISNKKVSLGINFANPVSGIVTSRFGSRSSPGGIGSTNHKGLDIAASTGTTIKAAASGTVTFAGYKGSLGNLVIISHGNGVETYYGHCSRLYVSKGEEVKAGDKIAAVGQTGTATGPHLHFEIRVNGSSINPLGYVNY